MQIAKAVAAALGFNSSLQSLFDTTNGGCKDQFVGCECPEGYALYIPTVFPVTPTSVYKAYCVQFCINPYGGTCVFNTTLVPVPPTGYTLNFCTGNTIIDRSDTCDMTKVIATTACIDGSTTPNTSCGDFYAINNAYMCALPQSNAVMTPQPATCPFSMLQQCKTLMTIGCSAITPNTDMITLAQAECPCQGIPCNYT